MKKSFPPFLLLSSAEVAHASVALGNPFSRIGTLKDLFEILLTIMQYVVSPILVLMLVYAGFRLVMARGNEKEVESARAMILWTIVGIAIVIGAQIISTAVQNTAEPFFNAVK